MKKRRAILIALALAVALGALTIVWLTSRPRLSMTLVEYKQWPHGAMVRLANRTSSTVRYFALRDETPAGSLVLCRKQTQGGWTNTSPTIRTARTFDPKTRTVDENSILAVSFGSGGQQDYLLGRELKPGKSVEFFVRLEPGATPQRVGTVYSIPQANLTKKLHTWFSGIKERCGLKPTLPRHLEVWCPETLFIPSAQDSTQLR
jgi:hypothetical protein